MNPEEQAIINAWLQDDGCKVFQKHLDLIMSEVGIQLLDNQNYNPDAWKFFTDYLMGKRIGVDIIRRVLFNMHVKKNTPSKIAKWKGVFEVLGQLRVFIQTQGRQA